MVKTIIAEWLFVIGQVGLVIVLIIFGLILRKLLRLIRKPSLFWILLVLSSLFMLVAVVFHFLSITEAGSVEDPVDLMRSLGASGIIEAIMLLASGLFAVIASGMYFRWSHR